MIIAFYVCMMVVGAVVLIYAIVTSAPIIAERATDAWDWWRMVPIHDLLIVPLSEALKIPIADYSALWDPWGGGAVGGVSVLVLLWVFIRYVPRWITGSIGGY